MIIKRLIMYLTVSLCVILPATPVPASAQVTVTGNLTISGTVPETITITIPDNFTLGNLIPESVESGAQTVTVTSNATGWSLTVQEAGESPDGRMARNTDGKLTNGIMEVKGGDQASYASVASAVTLKTNATTTTDTINNIYFKQNVSANDEKGTYSITLVFTVFS